MVHCLAFCLPVSLLTWRQPPRCFKPRSYAAFQRRGVGSVDVVAASQQAGCNRYFWPLQAWRAGKGGAFFNNRLNQLSIF